MLHTNQGLSPDDRNCWAYSRNKRVNIFFFTKTLIVLLPQTSTGLPGGSMSVFPLQASRSINSSRRAQQAGICVDPVPYEHYKGGQSDAGNTGDVTCMLPPALVVTSCLYGGRKQGNPLALRSSPCPGSLSLQPCSVVPPTLYRKRRPHTWLNLKFEISYRQNIPQDRLAQMQTNAFNLCSGRRPTAKSIYVSRTFPYKRIPLNKSKSPPSQLTLYLFYFIYYLFTYLSLI